MTPGPPAKKTTLDTYGQLWPDSDESARAAVGAVLAARGDWLATERPDLRENRRSGRSDDSDVVVHRELVRVRPQTDRVDLVLPLVLDPGLDQVGGEHPAVDQVLVVGLEVVEDGVQRGRHLLDAQGLLGRQLVEVLADRRRRLDLVLDAVEPGHQHRREGEVRVGRRVGHAELDALGLWV